MQVYRQDFTAMAGPCALQVYAAEASAANDAGSDAGTESDAVAMP